MKETFVFVAIMLLGNLLVNVLIQIFAGEGVHPVLSVIGGIFVAVIAISFTQRSRSTDEKN